MSLNFDIQPIGKDVTNVYGYRTVHLKSKKI